jgi:hypothetical protein
MRHKGEGIDSPEYWVARLAETLGVPKYDAVTPDGVRRKYAYVGPPSSRCGTDHHVPCYDPETNSTYCNVCKTPLEPKLVEE